MQYKSMQIPDVVLIEPMIHSDHRGWFMESFNLRDFTQGLHSLGLPVPASSAQGMFVQDNHSCSDRGVLRGLHYQRAPYAQGKLVRVIQGGAYDVPVDIRPHSPTFAQYVAVELTADNHKMLWIPDGFAHGFLALTDNTQLLYKTTDYYRPDAEGVICWNDPQLAIDWPDVGPLRIKPSDRDAPCISTIVAEQ